MRYTTKAGDTWMGIAQTVIGATDAGSISAYALGLANIATSGAQDGADPDIFTGQIGGITLIIPDSWIAQYQVSGTNNAIFAGFTGFQLAAIAATLFVLMGMGR